MIGPRIGPAVGPRVGLAVGVSADEISTSGSLAGVARDSTSGIYCPATANEWSLVMAAAGISSGGPSAVYLLQEASGNAADSVGTFTLTATGTGLAYQQAAAGWSRLAITTTAGATGLLQNLDAGLPDLSTTSQLLLTYAQPTTTATSRNVNAIGAAATSVRSITQATTGNAQCVCVANSANGAFDPTGAIRPWAIKLHRTASAAVLYTDQERLTPTFNATVAGKSITLGRAGEGDATCKYVYSACFFGPAAELSTAQVKTLLQTLGWTIPWT